MSTISPRPFLRYAEIRATIEVPTKQLLWGKSHSVTPAVCPVGFGNQLQLLVVGPINQRPNYYVVAIDSRWELGHDNPRWNLNEDEFRDFVDDIQEALTDHFGSHPDDPDHGDLDGCGCKWPIGLWDSGCSWSLMRWPETTVAPTKVEPS